jgi:hypothetical protein
LFKLRLCKQSLVQIIGNSCIKRRHGWPANIRRNCFGCKTATPWAVSAGIIWRRLYVAIKRAPETSPKRRRGSSSGSGSRAGTGASNSQQSAARQIAFKNKSTSVNVMPRAAEFRLSTSSYSSTR